jgi:hypothetical protein
MDYVVTLKCLLTHLKIVSHGPLFLRHHNFTKFIAHIFWSKLSRTRDEIHSHKIIWFWEL